MSSAVRDPHTRDAAYVMETEFENAVDHSWAHAIRGFLYLGPSKIVRGLDGEPCDHLIVLAGYPIRAATRRE